MDHDTTDPSSDVSIRWPRPDPEPGPTIPIAPAQRGQDGDGTQHPGGQVGDGDADLGRTATLGVGHAGDGHEPGDRLDDEVEAWSVAVGPAGSVARDRQADEASG